MKKIAAVAVLCLLSTSLAAQMKKTPSKPATPQRAPLAATGTRATDPNNFARISMADAYKLYQAGQAVFIDVRSNEQFSYGHIKGALSIPGSQLIRRYAEVPPKKTVILYCACSAEQSSGRAAVDLGAHGVKNVFALKGGWAEWKSNGYPTAVGPK